MSKAGHWVESALLDKLGLSVYVPSVAELQAIPDIIMPFQGQSAGEEVKLRSVIGAGQVLMRLIWSFGLPNAPEYHDWSEDFMNFKRECTSWEFIFQVNARHYLYVADNFGEVTLGFRTTPDREIREAFLCFIQGVIDTV